MRKKSFFTESISCDVESPSAPRTQPKETEFEKRRGVRNFEARRGYSQVHVESLEHPVMAERLRVLDAVAQANVSIDFLKLTPTGLSFLVAEDRSSAVEAALKEARVQFEIQRERSIVLVHAVNIRDEEGLTAEILTTAIGSGATVDHIGDMHDRLLMVVRTNEVPLIEREIRARWTEVN